VSAEAVISVVVIDRDTSVRESIRSMLTQIGTKVSGETDGLAAGLGLIKGLRPHILILELPNHPDSTLEAIQRIKNSFPEMGIIVTGGDSSPQLILKSMRAGAQEFLPRPVNLRELAEAVKRLAGRAKQAAVSKKKPGKIITIFSNKGGIGVTSIATNLAVSFAVNAKKSTSLVDLNMQMAEVSLHLDLRPKYTLADALGSGHLDESRLKGLLTEHPCGLALLSTPEDPVDAEMISPELLIETFMILKGMFDVTVVDAGHVFDSRVLEVLGLSDMILVIAGLDVPTVRNTHRCLRLFEQLNYKEKVRLVVNREQKSSQVDLEDLEELTGYKVLRLLPSDYKALISAIDSGVPAVLHDPKAKISRGIEALTGDLIRLLEMDVLQTGTPEPAATSEPGRRFFKSLNLKAG
jgi:pilus assembly protein CpaE